MDIKSGCHLAIMSGINPKIQTTLPTVVFHNLTRFHENCSKTFHLTVFKNKNTIQNKCCQLC